MFKNVRVNKIDLPNINDWETNFKKSGRLDKIIIDYNNEIANKKILILDNFTDVHKTFKNITPRELSFLRSGNFSESLPSFYMVDYIVKNTKEYPIIDIGCGMNIFKQLFPIIGLDTIDSRADILGYFTDEFVLKNLLKFSAAISINSLHFVSIDKLADRIIEFSQIIRKNGLGYFTINSCISASVENSKFIVDNNISNNTSMLDLIFNQILQIEPYLELLYYEDLWFCINAGINGDIRIIFRKK